MYPITAWQHTCTEIVRILTDMISSIEFIRHLASSCCKVSSSSAAESSIGGFLDDKKIETHLMELRKAVISLVK